MTPTQGAYLWNILQAAKKALERDACRKVVSENAARDIDYLWNNRLYTYFNGVYFREDEDESFAETGTPGNRFTRAFNSTRTVLGYNFFSDERIKEEAKLWGISDPFEMRKLIILHEIKHYGGWRTGNDVKADQTGSQNIKDNCL